MGVKSNLSQAVSEMMGISRNVERSQEENEVDSQEFPEEETAAEETQAETIEENGAEAGKDSEILAGQQEEAVLPQNPRERVMTILAAQQAAQSQTANEQQSQTVKEEQLQATEGPDPEAGVTTIARGTTIIGEINADGDVELLGSVKGKVASRGDIRANGKVIGDLVGRDIELIACAVQGNIVASGMVTVDGDSVVVGDVNGENFCLDGKIKGNVTVEKEATFQPKAILAGNVTTASIAMSQGAKIQGEVNIPLGEKDADMPFEIDMKI